MNTILTRGIGPVQQLVTRGYGSLPQRGGGGVGRFRRPQRYWEYDPAIRTMHMHLPHFPKDIQVKVTLLDKDTKKVTAIFDKVSANPFKVFLIGEVEHD